MNLQPNYAAGVAVGVPGMVASEELSNKISRTVETALGLLFGQPAFRGANDHGVIAGATLSGSSVSSVEAGNVGTGTITANPAVAAPAMAGRYIVEMLATGVAGAFNLLDPNGAIVDDGVAGTAKTAGGIGPFTIGGTPTIADRFYIDVTLATDARFVGLTRLADNARVATGTQTVDAYQQYDTAAIMTQGVMWVLAGGNVAPGGLVYWDPATSRYVTDATKIRIPNARFDSTGANGALVKVAIRERDG